ncbi:MAG: SRPBCC family protein [Sphingomonadales bacterium]|nr:SRPBCC family protein [Sphingomonadales bacterium]
MIETEQSVTVAAGIEDVWDFVRDMQRWASIMPGYREFDVIDDDNSLWTLKVGVGGLVRTVKVRVHVEEWDGPGRVPFTFSLQGDPVTGKGLYLASAVSPAETAIALQVQVVGGGPMAPMWEAMGRPLLPTLAKGFAEQLKAEIEAVHAPAAATTAEPGSAFMRWLRSIWRALFGKRKAA